MSAKLADLGYEIETKYQPDGKRRHEVSHLGHQGCCRLREGVESVNGKNSRRTDEIEGKEQEIVAEIEEARS